MIHSSDIAFTPTVKSIQQEKGSRRHYARMEEEDSWQTSITPELASFIEAQTSVYLATANKDLQPYIQHRGGPAGFLKALDEETIGFADFAGNRQYVTIGNLADNPKAYLFLMDYARRRRVKIWGTARVAEDDAELVARLTPDNYEARAERAILFSVRAWDVNCPRHIPLRFEASEVTATLAERDARIAALEEQLRELRERARGGGIEPGEFAQ